MTPADASHKEAEEQESPAADAPEEASAEAPTGVPEQAPAEEPPPKPVPGFDADPEQKSAYIRLLILLTRADGAVTSDEKSFVEKEASQLGRELDSRDFRQYFLGDLTRGIQDDGLRDHLLDALSQLVQKNMVSSEEELEVVKYLCDRWDRHYPLLPAVTWSEVGYPNLDRRRREPEEQPEPAVEPLVLGRISPAPVGGFLGSLLLVLYLVILLVDLAIRLLSGTGWVLFQTDLPPPALIKVVLVGPFASLGLGFMIGYLTTHTYNLLLAVTGKLTIERGSSGGDAG